MKYVSWSDYKAVTADLKLVYSSSTKDEASPELARFGETWDEQYPQINKSCRTHWQNLNTLFNYPADIRKAIHKINAIESLNSVIRKAIPSDDLSQEDGVLCCQSGIEKVDDANS